MLNFLASLTLIHLRRPSPALLVLLTLFLLPTAFAQQFSPDLYAGMHWRLIGPFRSGRALAVAGVPSQPEVAYFGAVGCVIWKTTDGGRVWRPIFDREPVASIGALAIAPSDPNIIYAGTGEADMRSDISVGAGLYQSTDGGANWQFLGLADTRQIGSILIDPHDPNRVYVAAPGHAYGPNSERGVYRSLDGAKPGRRCYTKTRIPEQLASPLIRMMPKSFMPRSGRRAGLHGVSIHRTRAPVPASTVPSTAAAPGRSLPVTACPPATLGASALLLVHTGSAFTP